MIIIRIPKDARTEGSETIHHLMCGVAIVMWICMFWEIWILFCEEYLARIGRAQHTEHIPPA